MIIIPVQVGYRYLYEHARSSSRMEVNVQEEIVGTYVYLLFNLKPHGEWIQESKIDAMVNPIIMYL
jgi:hypothetical protein